MTEAEKLGLQMLRATGKNVPDGRCQDCGCASLEWEAKEIEDLCPTCKLERKLNEARNLAGMYRDKYWAVVGGTPYSTVHTHECAPMNILPKPILPWEKKQEE